MTTSTMAMSDHITSAMGVSHQAFAMSDPASRATPDGDGSIFEVGRGSPGFGEGSTTRMGVDRLMGVHLSLSFSGQYLPFMWMK